MDVSLLLKYSKDVRVLYVEDDDNLRESTASLFENFFLSVTTAIDGENGLELYKQSANTDEAFDLIITDIDMPKLNGIDMSKEILKDKPLMDVIFITAHDEKKYSQDADELGIKNLITKPINFDKLCNSIYEVCKTVVEKKKA